jgi:hypothetical protein
MLALSIGRNGEKLRGRYDSLPPPTVDAHLKHRGNLNENGFTGCQNRPAIGNSVYK